MHTLFHMITTWYTEVFNTCLENKVHEQKHGSQNRPKNLKAYPSHPPPSPRKNRLSHIFRPRHRGSHTRAWKQGYHPIILEIPIVLGPQNLFIDLRICPQIPFTILLPILSQTMPQRSPPQKRPLNTTYNGVYRHISGML